MTAQPTGAAADRADELRGAVPHDEGAALSTVENGNLPACLHEQFLEIFRDNTLTRPGGLSVLGTPVDLSRIAVPTFVTGAVDDHLTPGTGWAGAEPGPSAAVWRDTADPRTGTRWEARATWVLERSGAEVEAPAAVGSDRHPPLEPAPGAYVLDRVP